FPPLCPPCDSTSTARGATILSWRVMAEYGAICRQIKEKIADLPYFTWRNTKRYGVGNFRGPRSAISGREQSQQNPLYSITSSASESRLSEILMPSASAVLRLIT